VRDTERRDNTESETDKHTHTEIEREGVPATVTETARQTERQRMEWERDIYVRWAGTGCTQQQGRIKPSGGPPPFSQGALNRTLPSEIILLPQYDYL
jgi:hypothetical protein